MMRPYPELTLLRQSVEKFSHNHVANSHDNQPEIWQNVIDMGLLHLMEMGEGSLALQAGVTVGEIFGKNALPVHFPAAALFAAVLFSSCMDKVRAATFYDEILSGRIQLALLTDSLSGNYVPVKREGQRIAVGAPVATHLLLPRLSNDNQLQLSFIALSSSNSQQVQMVDGRAMLLLDANFSLPSADVPTFSMGNGQALLNSAVATTLLVAAADNLGAMHYLFEETLAYMQMRQQFGRSLSAFQTIQFRLVDMSIKLDEARALIYAVSEETNGQTDTFLRQARAAWIQTLWSGQQIAKEAVQLHGGMGMAQESRTTPFIKRLLCNEYIYGNERWHLKHFA